MECHERWGKSEGIKGCNIDYDLADRPEISFQMQRTAEMMGIKEPKLLDLTRVQISAYRVICRKSVLPGVEDGIKKCFVILLHVVELIYFTHF